MLSELLGMLIVCENTELKLLIFGKTNTIM